MVSQVLSQRAVEPWTHRKVLHCSCLGPRVSGASLHLELKHGMLRELISHPIALLSAGIIGLHQYDQLHCVPLLLYRYMR